MGTKDGVLQGAAHAEVLAIDTEANGNDVRDGRGYCMGVSLAYRLPGLGIISEYFPFRHRSDNLEAHVLAKLKEVIESHPRVVFHNAVFDIPSLATLGIHVDVEQMYDTMIMAHMVNENWTSKALDWLGWELLRTRKKSDAAHGWAKVWGWHSIPVEVMTDYAKVDAEICLRLYERLWPDMVKQNLHKLWPFEQQFIKCIIRMESRGIRIEKELCKRQAAIGRSIMEDIEKALGYSPSKPSDLKVLLIDVLGLPVVKWTQTDENGNPTEKSKPSFDKFAMAEYDQMLEERGDRTAQLILEYRGWQKAVSSNYEPYYALVSPDGRLRPSYKIHGTLTGRLSCEKPNLQQIPRVSDKDWNGRMKDAFIPAPGYVLIEGDYSQLEFRLAAAYAKEEKLISVFNDISRDVFTEMSEQIGMPRHEVKTMTYTIQYGGGVTRLKNVFKISEGEAKARRDAYYDNYPALRAISKAASQKARSQRYLQLWTGRRRHFVDPEKEAHKAFNSVIQGGAAEIVKRSMLRAMEELDDDDKCRMLLQVHDSIVFEVKEEYEEEYRKKIKEVMEAIPEPFGVKFLVDVHRWGGE